MDRGETKGSARRRWRWFLHRAAQGDERHAMVAAAQPAQAVIVGAEVVDARDEPRQLGDDDVQLDVVERSRARRGAKADFATGVAPAPEDSVGEVTEPRQRLQVGDGI